MIRVLLVLGLLSVGSTAGAATLLSDEGLPPTVDMDAQGVPAFDLVEGLNEVRGSITGFGDPLDAFGLRLGAGLLVTSASLDWAPGLAPGTFLTDLGDPAATDPIWRISRAGASLGERTLSGAGAYGLAVSPAWEAGLYDVSIGLGPGFPSYSYCVGANTGDGPIAMPECLAGGGAIPYVLTVGVEAAPLPPPTAVPAPAAFALLASGLGVLAAFRRRRAV